MKKTIDVRGKLCPEPLMITRKAIKESSNGDSIEIVTDNETACKNIGSYLKELKITFIDRDNHIYFVLGEEQQPTLEAIPECSISEKTDNGYIVVLKSEEMGNATSELGILLMRAFISTLADSDKLPKTIIMYNGGVKLAKSGTDTARGLKKLEEMGVELIICGTCVDFYQLKEDIKIGTISNMFVIVQKLSHATNIIYP